MWFRYQTLGSTTLALCSCFTVSVATCSYEHKILSHYILLRLTQLADFLSEVNRYFCSAAMSIAIKKHRPLTKFSFTFLTLVCNFSQRNSCIYLVMRNLSGLNKKKTSIIWLMIGNFLLFVGAFKINDRCGVVTLPNPTLRGPVIPLTAPMNPTGAWNLICTVSSSGSCAFSSAANPVKISSSLYLLGQPSLTVPTLLLIRI